MINNNITLKKSLMYKTISLGFPVYIGDAEDEFLVTALLCSECNNIWSMSRSECIFCGFENPHVYECRVCGKKYSITRATKKCCNQNLSKICINKNCISNTIPEIQEMYDKMGGIFQGNKSGATLNEMRCKKCGCKTNIYKSIIIKIVDNLDTNTEYEKDICVLKREDDSTFTILYENKKYNFKDIKSILIKVLKIDKIEEV